jgi:acetyl esterase/lipase
MQELDFLEDVDLPPPFGTYVVRAIRNWMKYSSSTVSLVPIPRFHNSTKRNLIPIVFNIRPSSTMALRNTHYGKFSPEFQEWLKTTDLSAMDAMDNMPPAEARKLMAQIEGANLKMYEGMNYTDYPINRDGVTARVFRLQNEQPGETLKPLVVIFHGGGWMYGGHTTETRLFRAFVTKLGFIAVNIDYRMAPEFPFPVPFEDCCDGLKWAIDHAFELGADNNNIFLAGSSAGGNLVAAVSQWAQKEGLKCIKGQALQSPATCHYRHFPKGKWELESYKTLENVPVLPAKKMSRFWGE